MDLIIIPTHIRAIQTTARLARLLGTTPAHLEAVAEGAKSFYQPFPKRKPNGKTRRIDNPTGDLRVLQVRINRRMLAPVHASFPPYMTGAIKGRSTRTNARQHASADALFKFDLRDCYGSISDGHVHSMWHKIFECSAEVATLLMKLTSVDKGIPQGASTSPTIANIVLFPLLSDLAEQAEKNDLRFTMFVDDGTISGKPSPVRQTAGEFIDTVIRHGYAISSRKNIVLRKGRDQLTVTGLRPGLEPKPPRAYIEEIRRRVIKEKNSTGNISLSTAGTIAYIKSYDQKAAEKLASLVNGKRRPNGGTSKALYRP